MEVTVASIVQDGHVIILGVWFTKSHSHEDIIKEVTNHYGEQPGFSDFSIKLHTSFVD